MASVSQLEARLDSVNTAISRIEQSLTQEHWTGGDRHRAPELATLYNERRQLEADLSKAKSSGGLRTFKIKVAGD